jgi:hypothetical protein
MDRKSRERRERREEKESGSKSDRAKQLEEKLTRLADGDAFFWTSKDCPPDLCESNLEDILAFESVGSGTSLFLGLQEHGMDLPNPEELNEQQSAAKVQEVLNALLELQIILVGFDGMSAHKLYSTLWNETLWEGCYVKKRHPGAMTVIDVSHRIPRSEILKVLGEIARSSQTH